jgi:hypothetical protein
MVAFQKMLGENCLSRSSFTFDANIKIVQMANSQKKLYMRKFFCTCAKIFVHYFLSEYLLYFNVHLFLFFTSHQHSHNTVDMSEHRGNTDTPKVEAMPIEAKVVSGDERTSAWYHKQSEGPGLGNKYDAPICRITGSLKRTLEDMEDTIMIAEDVFNSSVSSERKYRLICRISSDLHEKFAREFSPYTCCDE